MPLDSDFLNQPQPAPQTNPAHPQVWDLVYMDLQMRDAHGQLKYHTRLTPFNGRDPLIDLYQELMDALVYTRQALYEKYGK